MSKKRKKRSKRLSVYITSCVLCLLGVIAYVFSSVLVKPGIFGTEILSGTKVTNVQEDHFELARISDNRSQQIIEHLAYTVSYNPDWLIPNWVAYELTGDEVSGEQERSDHFAPDPLVEGDPVVTKDYSNSGYDRGHMAPAGDMKWSEQAMRESFYMTNICPQNHNNNAGDWKDLQVQSIIFPSQRNYASCVQLYMDYDFFPSLVVKNTCNCRLFIAGSYVDKGKQDRFAVELEPDQESTIAIGPAPDKYSIHFAYRE
jgi:hypothetical protein